MPHPSQESPLLLREIVHGEVHFGALPGGDFAAFSERAPGKLRNNEDAAAVIPLGDECVLLVVADGLGGQPGADQASGLTIETILAALDEAEGDPFEVLPRALEEANALVEELGLGAGTTIAAALVAGQQMRSFHVGDSTVAVIDSRGGVKFETVAHSPIGYALASGLLTEEEALHHPERHIISNMVGSPEMRLETGPSLRLDAEDTIVLSSDGLTDNLYRAEVSEIVRTASLEQAAKELVDLMRVRMTGSEQDLPTKPDDGTFVLYRCDS